MWWSFLLCCGGGCSSGGCCCGGNGSSSGSCISHYSGSNCSCCIGSSRCCGGRWRCCCSVVVVVVLDSSSSASSGGGSSRRCDSSRCCGSRCCGSQCNFIPPPMPRPSAEIPIEIPRTARKQMIKIGTSCISSDGCSANNTSCEAWGGRAILRATRNTVQIKIITVGHMSIINGIHVFGLSAVLWVQYNEYKDRGYSRRGVFKPKNPVGTCIAGFPWISAPIGLGVLLKVSRVPRPLMTSTRWVLELKILFQNSDLPYPLFKRI